jgi:hypothetical protein
MERLTLILIGTVFWTTSPSWGQETARPTSSEAAIRQSAPAYVKAFNTRDSKGLASQWSPDAVYVNRPERLAIRRRPETLPLASQTGRKRLPPNIAFTNL